MWNNFCVCNALHSWSSPTADPNGETEFGGPGEATDYNLAEALWTCSNFFASVSSTKVETKRVLIFSNNEHPHVDNLDRQVVVWDFAHHVRCLATSIHESKRYAREWNRY